MGWTLVLRTAAFAAALLVAAPARALLPPASSWDLPGIVRVTVGGPGGSQSQLGQESIRLAFDGAGAWTLDFVTDPLPPDLSGTVQDARGRRFALVVDPAAEAAYFEALRLAILEAQPLIADLQIVHRSSKAKGRIRSGEDGDVMFLKTRLRVRMQASVLGRNPRLSVALKGRYVGALSP